MILINGKSENRINISDRGLQYGDGLFETIAYRHHKLELWPEHRARLLLGCHRLNIPFTKTQLEQLELELAEIAASLQADAIIKIILTRGEGGRGYRPDPQAIPTRIISTHPMPEYPDTYERGISVRFCEQQVSENPGLAGLKHLNRLEQVLARAEWDNLDIAEGLMFNLHDQVIEGTMTNLFIVSNGNLITPDLILSGVVGIIRNIVIELALSIDIPVQQRIISRTELLTADELFVTNSIIKIWPITRIESISSQYSHGAITQHLQEMLARRLTE